MKNNWIYTCAFIALLLGLAACGAETKEQKIVFMDNFKVFEEFELKKEYDSLLLLDQEKFKAELNALSSEIDSKSKTPGNQLQADVLKKDYALLQQKLSEELEAKSSEYTGIVYNRLNSYVSSYGKENNYSFILGTDGKGNVMYVDSTCDITKELIKYINKKYNDE